MKYNKLVRDNIPEIIKEKGKTPITRIAEEREHWDTLKEKLQEEVDEFIFAKNEEEFADILEVLDAIAEYKGFDKNKIQDFKNEKAKHSGKFQKKIILEEVT